VISKNLKKFSIDFWLYSSYTANMKTAISIPDKLYNDAEITAKQLGLARSQLYAKAIREFIEHHNKEEITEKLNAVYSQESMPAEINEAGLESLREASRDDSW